MDLRSLFNPAASYAPALGFLLIGGLLQIVIGIATMYAVGRELADRTAPEWLEAARARRRGVAWEARAVHGGPLPAGGGAGSGCSRAWYGIPVRGPAWLLVVGTAAFVLAIQASAS